MGYTDDRTKIWAASLNSDRLFIFDVTDPMNPKLTRTIDNVAKTTGLSGPHTPYAIPGRILVSMASGPNGSGPGGIAEFTNDGDFVASHPTDQPSLRDGDQAGVQPHDHLVVVPAEDLHGARWTSGTRPTGPTPTPSWCGT